MAYSSIGRPTVRWRNAKAPGSTISEAPRDPTALVDGLVERLVAAGVQLARVRIGLNTLHPEVAAVGITWRRGVPTCRDPVTYSFIEAIRQSGKPPPIPQIVSLGV